MNIIGVILGGGVGSRLKPLTVLRSKPAVPLGGKYRLVDVPISNCINSSILKIYMLTQYNSGSLHYHVQSAYQFDSFSKGFVRLLAAEQTPESEEWFQGTADAVRQSMHHLASSNPDIVVILSGDQLYRMDFQRVIDQHIQQEAEVTICSTLVTKEEASSFGILQANDDGRITGFEEKPSQERLSSSQHSNSLQDKFQASMGIYVFNMKTLETLLSGSRETDFGSHIIPRAIDTHRVFSYLYNGYWRDIGTIGSFWRTNLELTGRSPSFSFYDNGAPIYTRARFLPPSQLYDSHIKDCLITEGVKVFQASLANSVIGLRSVIREGTKITNSVVMGNDIFERDDNPGGNIHLGIGEDCSIDCAIIDKDVRIGNNVQLSPHGMEDVTTDLFTIRDGVIVIPKGVSLPPGFKVGG